MFIFIAMCFPAVPYYFDLVFDIIELLSIELVAPIPWHLNPIKKNRSYGGTLSFGLRAPSLPPAASSPHSDLEILL